jgi:hypothetical protein
VKPSSGRRLTHISVDRVIDLDQRSIASDFGGLGTTGQMSGPLTETSKALTWSYDRRDDRIRTCDPLTPRTWE